MAARDSKKSANRNHSQQPWKFCVFCSSQTRRQVPLVTHKFSFSFHLWENLCCPSWRRAEGAAGTAFFPRSPLSLPLDSTTPSCQHRRLYVHVACRAGNASKNSSLLSNCWAGCASPTLRAVSSSKLGRILRRDTEWKWCLCACTWMSQLLRKWSVKRPWRAPLQTSSTLFCFLQAHWILTTIASDSNDKERQNARSRNERPSAFAFERRVMRLPQSRMLLTVSRPFLLFYRFFCCCFFFPLDFPECSLEIALCDSRVLLLLAVPSASFGDALFLCRLLTSGRRGHLCLLLRVFADVILPIVCVAVAHELCESYRAREKSKNWRRDRRWIHCIPVYL